MKRKDRRKSNECKRFTYVCFARLEFFSKQWRHHCVINSDVTVRIILKKFQTSETSLSQIDFLLSFLFHMWPEAFERDINAASFEQRTSLSWKIQTKELAHHPARNKGRPGRPSLTTNFRPSRRASNVRSTWVSRTGWNWLPSLTSQTRRLRLGTRTEGKFQFL